jgi:UDP-N-acetylglucosamine 4,6-dehydratase/5-epimerase
MVMNDDWSGQTILITGGTGSLGSALCRYFASREEHPNRLVIYSRRWEAQGTLRRELGNPNWMRWINDDIRDYDRLETAMRDIDYVIHTAAYKSVPDAEYNPLQAIHVNVLGTANVLRAALQNMVGKVLVISTDKAVSAINTYGRSKALCESLTVAYNTYSGGAMPRFAVARYGNVATSSGSVIPLFQELAKRGSITVTNPLMTRFFVTMDQAVEFVLRCLDSMQGGEIFVPKLKAASIMTVVRAIAPGTEVEIIGERPGEKEHEELLSTEEIRTGRVYDMGSMYYIAPQFPFWDASYQPSGSLVRNDFSYTSLDAFGGASRLSVDDIAEMAK